MWQIVFGNAWFLLKQIVINACLDTFQWSFIDSFKTIFKTLPFPHPPNAKIWSGHNFWLGESYWPKIQRIWTALCKIFQRYPTWPYLACWSMLLNRPNTFFGGAKNQVCATGISKIRFLWNRLLRNPLSFESIYMSVEVSDEYPTKSITNHRRSPKTAHYHDWSLAKLFAKSQRLLTKMSAVYCYIIIVVLQIGLPILFYICSK